MCCSGIIVDIVAISDNDSKDIFFHLIDDKEKKGGPQSFFPLPCPYHSGHHCEVYNDAPKVCKVWQCKLLSNFESGKIDYAFALSKINLVKDMASQVDSFLQKHGQENKTISWRKRLSNYYRIHYPDLDKSDYSKHNTELLLNVSAIDVYAKNLFIPDKNKDKNIL